MSATPLPETMQVVRLHGPEDLRVSTEPLPEPGPGEVLLRVRAVGVCASDVHYFNEGGIGDQVVQDPLVLGHEVGAEVAGIGPGVQDLRVGDRVAVEPGNNCGQCPACDAGLINLCPQVRFFGTPPTDGALREYVVWPQHLCLPVPDGLSLEEAAMTEPMAVGIYAMDLAELEGGESVVILGAGAIGLSVLQAAKAMGVGRKAVIEPIKRRAELARDLGADAVYCAEPGEAAAMAAQDFGGKHPRIVVECAGSNEAVEQAVKLAGLDGQVIVAGIPYPDEVRFPASTARRKNLTIRFVRRSRNAVERAILWAAAGEIDLSIYASHHFPLDRSSEALQLARSRGDGVLRAIVDV